jgi:hypothetical protein
VLYSFYIYFSFLDFVYTFSCYRRPAQVTDLQAAMAETAEQTKLALQQVFFDV